MKRKFAAVLFLSLPVAAFSQPVVWTTSSLVRTGQTDAAGSGTQATISAARGEYESFQIAVQAGGGGLSNVNVTVSDLYGPGGAVIAKSSFALFREQYVYVSQSSPDWGGSNRPLGAGWYPDGLIPFTDPSTGQPIQGAQIEAVPFNLNAASNQPIWVDLLVPRDAVAGQYTGTYTVSSDQGSVTGNIALTVWNFTLPLEPSLKSTFPLYQGSSVAADKELLRNKISPIHTDPAAQADLIANYGLNVVGLAYYSGSSVSNCTMSAPPSVADLVAAAAQQQPSLTKLVYSADETNYCPSLDPMIQAWGLNLHQAGLENLVTANPNPALFDDGSGSGRSAIDIWAVLPLGYDQSPTNNATALGKGDSLWSYNALVQDAYSPKWEIDFAPINYRIQPGFISQSLNLTGLLYWKVDNWTSDPWNQVNNTGVYAAGNYPGEGMLVYPGSQVGIDGVAPSMRLKWLRDGVEDYEYVQMLKLAGQGTEALALAASVGPNWTNWTRDTNQLLDVREQLGQQLDQLNGSSTAASSPVPVVATPAAATGGSTQTATGGAGCANTLVVNFVQPSAGTVIQTAAPQTIQVKVTDNCGTALTAAAGGSVSATNGDGTVALQDWGYGIWNGTWTPDATSTQVTLTVSAKGNGAAGSAQVAVTVPFASHAVSVSAVVNAAAGAEGTPGVVTPGGYVSIYGTNLAGTGNSVASSLPLPTMLNGAQVFLGSTPIPLVYAAPNQINGIIPEGLDPASTYPLVVINAGFSSTPSTVSVARIQPAIFSQDASGSGQAVAYIVGDGELAAASGANARPVTAGEFLTLYCSALGPVSGPDGEGPPADGTATPGAVPLRTLGEVNVSIGGIHQTAQFAGLAPALVGVYQVNVQVPAGLSGDAVPVTITESDPHTGALVQSNTVTVALR